MKQENLAKKQELQQTNYYNDPDTIKILKETEELLKSENKLLKDKLKYYEK